MRVRPVVRPVLTALFVLATLLVPPSLAAPAAAAGVPNDHVAAATAVSSFPFRTVQQTVGATVESGEDTSCFGTGATVWFTFTTNGLSTLEVDAITAGVRNPDGSVTGEYRPALALFRGSPGSLTRVGCETGGNATNVGGTDLPAGRYYVQVGGVDGASGRLDLQIDVNLTGGGAVTGGAVVTSPGCTRNVLDRNDDGSTGEVALPFPVDFYGRTYRSLFVNNNGNVTFDAPLSTFTPFGLRGTSRSIIAPFFGDVDTRGTGSDTVKYGFGEVAFEGRQAFCVNWVNVGYFAGHTDKLNSFQLLLVDRSDRSPGAFDIVFNYDRVQWETGDASGGRGGLGGSPARAGFSNGSTDLTASYELPGSGVTGQLLDGAASGLTGGSLGSEVAGRYVFPVDGGSPTCAEDADCDGLSDATEAALGTEPENKDTDSDGLTDGAEVQDLSPADTGFRTREGNRYSSEQLFGPFGPADGQGCADRLDENLRPADGQYTCLNPPSNPRRKDVFVEIDVQDCTLGGCPDDLGLGPLPDVRGRVDPLHHTPNIGGLEEAVAMYGRAPVRNHDGSSGVTLHLLIDERIEHTPNCDQLPSAARPQYFGRSDNRGRVDLQIARQSMVRYLWSGHSTRRDSDCGNPNIASFGASGFGITELADYDNTPFGQVAVGGDTILMSLSPLWNCPSAIRNEFPIPNLGELGSCYREVEKNPVRLLGQPLVLSLDPGIFPAKVEGQDRRWPVSLLLGEFEADGGKQLWGRALSHTLGHALGLSDAEVRNVPAPAGRHQVDRRTKLSPLRPDSYSRWEGLAYAPSGPGGAVMTEQLPPYALLAETSLDLSDPDDDGKLEGDDNCPGTYNPSQSNSDNGRFGLGRNDADFGDACDPDIDGDGLRNSAPGEGETAVGGRMAGSAAPGGPATDPYPFDTDNDATDNDVDLDDDGDGVPDTSDVCVLDADAAQADTDGDRIGDRCDGDADGDTAQNDVELVSGSDPLVATSRPEYVTLAGTCTDGLDGDGDGRADAQDTGCQDSDGDGLASGDDRCAGLSSPVNTDLDDDGRAAPCDLSVTITGASARFVSSRSPDPVIAFRATLAGDYRVVDGEDCTAPAVLQGRYTPDPQRSRSARVTVPRAAIDSGRVTVCVTEDRAEAPETASAGVPLVVDLTAPAVSAPALAPASDTGRSSTDGVTAAARLTLTGTAEPLAVVEVSDESGVVGRTTTDAAGAWSVQVDAVEGPRTYQAVATDRAGNTSRRSPALPLLVDRTSPQVDVSSDAPDTGSETGSVTVTFTGSDAGTRATCRLDEQDPFACTSPQPVSAPVAGTHTVGVRVEDAAGNAGAGSTSFRTVRSRYAFTGFEGQPAPPAAATVRAGASTVLRFGLGGDQGLDVLAEGQPSSSPADCTTWATRSPRRSEQQPGDRRLTYDAERDRYQYVWKTVAADAGTCRVFHLGLDDGSDHSLRVRLR